MKQEPYKRKNKCLNCNGWGFLKQIGDRDLSCIICSGTGINSKPQQSEGLPSEFFDCDVTDKERQAIKALMPLLKRIGGIKLKANQ